MDAVDPASQEEGPDLVALLATYGSEHDLRWTELCTWLEASYYREVTLEAILFLIGVQTRGQGYEPELDKDRKQDLIMEGTFAAFATLGVYIQVGMEDDGAWIWERVADPVPELSVDDQEKLIKLAVMNYFEHEVGPIDCRSRNVTNFR